jgi:hypothetical protein
MYPGKYEWVGSPELGDCSIRIMAARADFDAGEWECQVNKKLNLLFFAALQVK